MLATSSVVLPLILRVRYDKIDGRIRSKASPMARLVSGVGPEVPP